MTKPSLKLLFLRKYRSSKKIYKQLRNPIASSGTTLNLSGVFPSARNRENGYAPVSSGNSFQSSAAAPSSSTSGTGSKRKKVTEPLDTVDCCVLLCDCLPELFKLRTFLILLVAGFLSTFGFYLHQQNLLQYRLTSTEITNNTPPSSSSADNNAPRTIKAQFSSLVANTLNFTSRSTSALRKLLNFNFSQRQTTTTTTRHFHSIGHDDDEYDYGNDDPVTHRIYRGDVFSPQHGIRLKRCTIPRLRPFAAEIKKFVGYTPKPNCVQEQHNNFDNQLPFNLYNGTLLVRNPRLKAEQTQGCCYRSFHRSGESSYWTSNKCTEITEEITYISETEYVELMCINSATQTDFRDAFALISPKEKAEGRIETFEANYENSSSIPPRMSVMILGLDATSRMNFLRAMPKANKYLLKTLNAISLDGYTKVRENTLPNVIPLLSGKTLEEFKRECVDESQGGSHVHLDGCPFIWKKFADNGYRTSLAEDDVDIGIFNMNWGNAFVNSPTDYYLRPLSHLMQKRHSYKDGYCYGPRLSFEKLLENARNMAEAFKDQTYFQFTWSTKLSHDDFNKMRWGDESLLELLQYLHAGNYLNNTALIICGDHGSRLDRIRGTAQGKLEDRMPVAYVVLPAWFKGKYSRAYGNLRENANRVTSAFDLHKTLYDFLNLDNLLRDNENDELIVLPNLEKVARGRMRGRSLFQEMPENRTCFAAGIPLHWCICHRKIPMDKDSQLVTGAAEFVVASLNTLLKRVGECARLRLQSVDEASKWDSSEIIREGSCQAYEKDNNTQNSTDCDDGDVLVIQVAFTTTPGDATFETTVIQLSDGGWRLTENVVRTNSYEGQSDCVEQKFKPYCYCSDDEDTFLGNFWKRR